MNFNYFLFRTLRRLTLGTRRFAERHGFLGKFTAFYEPLRKPVYDLLRPRGVVKIRAKGFIFYVSGEDYVVASDLMTYGYWEKEETQIMEKSLKPGMVCLDIGANFGYFSLIAGRCVGAEGRVYAFEPEPRNYELLCRNIEANGLSGIVIPVPKAVSKAAGTLNLFLSDRNYGGHSLAQSNIEWDFAGTVPVESIALDEFLERQGNTRIDFLKSDTQGAEVWMIQGARKTLERNPDLTLIFEFWPMGIEGFKENPEEFLLMLTNSGFRITVLEEGNLKQVRDIKKVIEIARHHSYVTLLLNKCAR